MNEKEKALPERERVEDVLAALEMLELMMRSRLPVDLILKTTWVRGISSEDPVRWVRDYWANKLKDAHDLIEKTL